MYRFFNYLNPIAHLGDKKYSYVYPVLGTVLAAVIIEILAYVILHDPNAIGLLAIFIFIALIVFFAFREGLIGGFIATGITIAYYFYIIYTRHYVGNQLISSIETTIVLAVLYFLLAGIIGWLKQTIDGLIEREADEKKRLQSILQQLPVGIIITDRDGKIVQSNKNVDNMLGVKVPLGYKVGQSLLTKTTYNGQAVTPSQSLLGQVLITGKPIVDREYIIERKDKKQVHLQVSAVAIHNRHNKIIAAAQIISDITQQKELEKRKDDFVNMASHELKTPLTSMKLYIELLMRSIRKYNDGNAVKLLGNIKDQTIRLQKLVNDLLDVSRLQTGKLTFEKEMFRLDELVTETIEVLNGSAKGQQLVTSKISPISVYGDRFRIYQVLTNLVTNAIKYSPANTDIFIKVYKKNGKAEVSIQDAGIGIDKEQRKKIFERLYQVTDDKEKTFPGFGMGLYISKEIIKRHKGSIWVDSEKGKGSTFYFTLPISDGKK